MRLAANHERRLTELPFWARSRPLRTGLAAGAIAGPLLLAVFLLVRRLLAEWQPPRAGILLAAGLAVAVWSLEVRWRLLKTAEWSREFLRLTLLLAPSLVSLLIGLVLWLPGTDVMSWLLLWGPLVSAESLFWFQHGPRLTRRVGELLRGATIGSDTSSPSNRPTPSAVAPGGAHATATVAVESVDGSLLREEADEGETAEDEPMLPPHVSQLLTRSRTDVGGECLQGLVRAQFAAQQRVVSLDLAICPPLRTRPVVSAEQLSGPAVEIQCPQAYPHGVRLDVKRSDDLGQAAEVILEFSASEG